MSDILKRAAWAQNSPRSWILKCRVQDGGAPLATVRLAIFSGCFWDAAGKQGHAGTRRSAMCAARKALRDGQQTGVPDAPLVTQGPAQPHPRAL